MAKTLAELRAQSGPAPRPKATRTVTLIEGQHLLDELRKLSAEHDDIMAAWNAERAQESEADREARERVRKAGQSPDEPPARAVEIRAEAGKINERLAEFQCEIELVGMTGGDWQRFKNDNPPREDNATDTRLAAGYVNADAVFASLGEFVKVWEGEPLVDGDWAMVSQQVIYADLRDLVTAVVALHEETISRAPKSRTSSPVTPTSGTD